MMAYLQPTPLEIVERCRFHTRKRLPGEAVAMFIAHLKQIAEYCNAAQMEVLIRDRLVCGNKWQQCLLAEGDTQGAQTATSVGSG